MYAKAKESSAATSQEILRDLNPDPLDLIETHIIVAPVVKPAKERKAQNASKQ